MRVQLLAQAAALALLAGPAFAQSAPAATSQAETIRRQTVIVTGSSIRREVTDSSVPLQIITIEDLSRESINSPEQFVALLTANGTGLDNLASNADVVRDQARGNNGASSANLRGQGSAGTLILLNGRRVAAHGLNGGAVDINQIPLGAIERIDVLKDGASAIYGTDAIGGVINFITRKNVEGLRLEVFGDKTEAGGGDIFRGSVTGGWGDLDEQGFNIMGTLTYSDHRALRGDQRDFVNTFQPDKGVSVDTRGTPFATIFPIGVNATWAPQGSLLGTAAGNAPFFPGQTTLRAAGGVNPLDLPGNLGCNARDGMQAYDERLWDIPNAQLACAWDTGRAAVLQQPIQTTTGFLRAVGRLGEHEIAFELTGSQADSAKRFSNAQLSTNTTTQAWYYPRNAASQATYDRIFNQLQAYFGAAQLPESRRGLPIAYRWRCDVCGPREIETTTDTARIFLGADGPVPWFEGWTYRAGAALATSESQSTLGSGYYYRDANAAAGVNGLVQVLNSGVINPFLLPGESQSQAALDLLKTASAEGVVLYGGKFEVTQYDLSASGPLPLKLWGGPILAAVGVDIRKEDYSFNGDQRAAAARPLVFLAPFDDGNALAGVSRDITAFYAEAALPILENLELTLAVRRDDYSGFGDTTNPKVSFKYRPIENLMFRGSYSTGFRVPSFNQIFNQPAQNPYTGADLANPFRCPGGRPNSQIVGCEIIQPVTISGGRLDLGPEEAEQYNVGVVYDLGPSFSASLDYWDIERTSTIRILTLRELIDNVNLFADRFLRDPAGNIIAIDQRWVNTGGSLTRGIDLSMRGAWDWGPARMTASFDATRLIERRERVLDTIGYGPNLVGVFTFSGDLNLRWKHNATLGFRMGDWSGSATQLFRNGYINQELPGVTNGRVSPPGLEKRVDNYITYNASLTYSGFDGFTITGGIKNLFDEDPPFAISYDSVTGAGSSWEPRVADPRGRAFTLRVAYDF